MATAPNVTSSASNASSFSLPKGVPSNTLYTITTSGKVVLRSPFYGFGKYVWAIYPDYWPEKWGRQPLFGYVSADDRFIAERVAYDVGLVYRNDTFKPKAVKSVMPKTSKPREPITEQ